MMGVLGQSLVSDFGEAELAFHHTKNVFDLGPDLRLVPVPRSFLIAERDIATALLVCEILCARSAFPNDIAFASVGRISPYAGLFPMQQICQHDGVMDIGSCGHNVMHQLGTTVYADVGLHPKEPLVSFAGLMHLRIALLLLVLGGTRCIDDAGIDDGPSAYLQPILLEILIDQMKQLIAQVVAFHHVAKLADRGFIRRTFLTQIDAYEVPHGARIVQGFLGCWVGEIEPMLKEINAQHPLHPDRPTAGTLWVRVVGLDGVSELFPGNNRLHVLKELLFACLLAELLKAVGQGLLLHTWRTQLWSVRCTIIAQVTNKSEMP